MVIALPSNAQAQDNSWIVGAGKWEMGGDWSLGVAPSTNDAADLITNTANSIVTIDETTVLSNAINGCMTISNLTVSAPSGSTNTLSLNNVGLATPLDILQTCTIGTNGLVLVSNSVLSGMDFLINGTLVASGGLMNAQSLSVGASGTSTVWVTDGELTVNSSVFLGAVNGIGQITVSNGTMLAGNMYVGYPLVLCPFSCPSQGALTLADSTTTLSGTLFVGYVLNVHSGYPTGTVWLSGGQLINTNASPGIYNNYATTYVGYSGVGQMTVSNGTMLAGNMYVGDDHAVIGGQGTLTIAGGTTVLSGHPVGPDNLPGFLSVGYYNHGTGTVWVTDGQLILTNETLDVGDGGLGEMTVSNGAVLAGWVYIGSGGGDSSAPLADGTLTIAGGVISSSHLLDVGRAVGATGTVWVTGGQVNIADNPIIVGDGGAGEMTVSNGTVSVGSLIVKNNAYGSTINTNLFTLDGGVVNSAGAAITNGLTFVVGDGTDAATYNLLGGIHSFANNLEITSNATLSGCGTVNGNVLVDSGGTVVANCGGTLTLTGSATNNGTMEAVNGSTLEAYGLVVNNGIIDIRGGTTNFPGGFINNGIVVTTNSIPVVTAIQVVGSDVEISVMTGNGDTYVFEEATNLVDPSWTSVIGFTGTGGVITFIDPGAATLPQRFYRIGLIPSP